MCLLSSPQQEFCWVSPSWQNHTWVMRRDPSKKLSYMRQINTLPWITYTILILFSSDLLSLCWVLWHIYKSLRIHTVRKLLENNKEIYIRKIYVEIPPQPKPMSAAPGAEGAAENSGECLPARNSTAAGANADLHSLQRTVSNQCWGWLK